MHIEFLVEHKAKEHTHDHGFHFFTEPTRPLKQQHTQIRTLLNYSVGHLSSKSTAEGHLVSASALFSTLFLPVHLGTEEPKKCFLD